MTCLELLLTRNFPELPAEKETFNRNGTSVEVILSSRRTDPNGFAVLHRLKHFQVFMSYRQPCQILSGEGGGGNFNVKRTGTVLVVPFRRYKVVFKVYLRVFSHKRSTAGDI